MDGRTLLSTGAFVLLLFLSSLVLVQTREELSEVPVERLFRAETIQTLPLPPLRAENVTFEVETPVRFSTHPDPLPPGRVRFLSETRLEFPQGTVISGLELFLPPSSVVEFPPSTRRVGEGWESPGSMKGSYPNGTRWGLPPRTRIVVPEEISPVGTELPSAAFSLTIPEGGVTLRIERINLPSGSNLTVPQGSTLLFPPGSVLPEEITGTETTLPPKTQLQSPTKSRGLEPPRIVPEVLLTSFPDSVEKGSSFVVRGVLVGSPRRPLGGATLELFLNESKEIPGVRAGRGVSLSDGSFEIVAEVPPELPPRPYHLVVRSHPYVLPSGEEVLEGWSDPLLRVRSRAVVEIGGPTFAGVGTRAIFSGVLRDSFGSPVWGGEIRYGDDKGELGRTRTLSDGSFFFALRFPSAGIFRIEATFEGDSNLTPARSSVNVTVLPLGFEIPDLVRLTLGSDLVLEGRVVRNGEGVAGEKVLVQFLGSEARSTSGTNGTFRILLSPPGNASWGAWTLVLGLPDRGISTEIPVWATLEGRVEWRGPSRGDTHGTFPIEASVRDPWGRPLGDLPVRVHWRTSGGSWTQEGRISQGGVLSIEGRAWRGTQGLYVLSLESLSPYVTLGPNTHSVDLKPLEVRWLWTPDLLLQPQRPSGSLGIALLFGSQPLSNTQVLLEVDSHRWNSTTDRLGRVIFVPPGGLLEGWHTLWVESLDPPSRTPLPFLLRARAVPILVEHHIEGERVLGTISVRREDGSPLGPCKVEVLLLDSLGSTLGRSVVEVRSGLPTPFEIQGTSRALGWTLLLRSLPDEGSPLVSESTSWTIVPPAAGLPIIPAILGGAALVLLGGVLLRIRRRRGRSAPPSPKLPSKGGTTLEIEIPGIPPHFPLVWGENEPFVFLSRIPPPAQEISVEGVGRFPVPNERVVRWTMPGRSKGEVEIRVKALDVEERLRLRIVSYKEEVAREFVRFLEDVEGVLPGIDRTSTPRDVRDVGESFLEADRRVHLKRMAEVAEKALFSPHPIVREEYLRFMRALLELRSALGGGGRSG